MKVINKWKSVAFIALATTCLTGCSDQFLEDKKSFGDYDESALYGSYVGAQSRVDELYNALLPESAEGLTWRFPSAGTDDEFAKCTEEYAGLGRYVDPAAKIDHTNVDDLIYQEVKVDRSPYGRIRDCNDVIEGVTNSSLSEKEKGELLGQALFFRAWCYYRLVKYYGGVPIIDKVQDPIDGADIVIPRSTTKACIDFICNDLQKASECLPASWAQSGSDYGRITAGACLALQARARLLYASPLFNRADKAERWQEAYTSADNALTKLQEGGWGLAYEEDPGTNASNWAKMFSDRTSVNKEAVFVTLYNNISEVQGQAFHKWNRWEQNIRPKNAYGGGGKTPTAEIIDMFPMADGKSAIDKNGNAINMYDKEHFFINRDPRFYRTFAFPGVAWKFIGTPTSLNTNNVQYGDRIVPESYPYSGGEYELWSYSWYTKEDQSNRDALDKTANYAADGLTTTTRSVYIRKRSGESGYDFSTNAGNDKGFTKSAAPYMEIRYAEVVLMHAEAACGVNKLDVAMEDLKSIRRRVGIPEGEDGTYGLGNISTREEMFAAILRERAIELAYEGKRFDDVRRWMLWDGGTGTVEGQPSAWALSAWSNNTCNYLNVNPLNDTYRTHIEVYVKAIDGVDDGVGDKNTKSDPLWARLVKKAAEDGSKVERVKAVNPDSDSMNITEGGNSNMDKLSNFYRTNFGVKRVKADGTDVMNVITFRPEYYFLGFKENMMKGNITLHQTIGWTDINHGGMGTFDPLAE